MTTPPTFDKWPPIGPSYEGYQNGRGETLTRELVIEKYLSKHGELPAEVVFCKPFLWLAGPVPGQPEDLPTLEEAMPAEPEIVSLDEIEESLIDAGLMGDPDETPAAAPVVEGQARLL